MYTEKWKIEIQTTVKRRYLNIFPNAHSNMVHERKTNKHSTHIESIKVATAFHGGFFPLNHWWERDKPSLIHLRPSFMAGLKTINHSQRETHWYIFLLNFAFCFLSSCKTKTKEELLLIWWQKFFKDCYPLIKFPNI